ncbi:hypothetical protein IP88_09915 [alpha proteobacterium AAP81b]|nr:hypothetical protein IP88_09915 [alpha proteobacterium AAP81b]
MAAIRRLGAADAAAFQALRVQALTDHPRAFGSDPAREAARTLAEVVTALETDHVLGAGTPLVGLAGFYMTPGLKRVHRGVLWGMYVAPAARRQGLGAALVAAIVAHARTRVEELRLGVAVDNAEAIALYQAAGFAAVGIDPHALKVGDCYVDELIMALRLAR